MTPLRPVPDTAGGRDDDPTCPLGRCDGSGWIVDEAADMARPCACREQRVKRVVTGRLRGGLSRRLLGASLERNPNLDPHLIAHVRSFAEGIDEHVRAGRGLWFHGPVGTGKTSLALYVAKAARDAGHTYAVYSVPLLLAEMRQTYARDADDSYMALFRRLSTVDLLVLDDLGAEKQTEWVLEQLYSLINERWQDERSIVVTTNSPDPYRHPSIGALREEVAEIRRLRTRGSRPGDFDGVVERLERVANDLAALQVANDTDPLTQLRQQIGTRTVSRLIEICDDPIPIAGDDLRNRIAAHGG